MDSDWKTILPPKTIYDFAKAAMEEEIARYLRLADISGGFTGSFLEDASLDEKDVKLLSAGVGIVAREMTIEQVNLEMARKSSVPFDVETAVTLGVYAAVRPYGAQLFDCAEERTNGWTNFDPSDLKANPQLLPVYQHVGGFFSKAQLKKEVGSVSDQSMSGPASERLAAALKDRVSPSNVVRDQVLSRLESTLEGIVRDLVGRVLLEEVVAHALADQGVPFEREDEYAALSGVVYDFRADFVIPDHKAPIAFIEVRKSSSRHASLYAKDKMFSAINWKGKHKNLIGVVVTEGDWTNTTLKIMATVFDYIVPLSKSMELAATLRRAVDGDASVLKWLIDFGITEAPAFGKGAGDS